MQGLPDTNNGQPQPSVVHIAQTVGAPYKYNLNSKTFIGLGITQLVIGVLCWGFQIGAAIIPVYFSEFFTGIWAGVFFIIAGALGIAASKKQTKCPIVAFMVMSIMSSIFTTPIFTTATMGLVFAARRCYVNNLPCNNRESMLALSIILMVLSVAEAVVGIASAALCCRATCGSRSNEAQQVAFKNRVGEHQVIILENGQQFPQQLHANQQANFQPQQIQGNIHIVQSGNPQGDTSSYSNPLSAYNTSVPPPGHQGVHQGAAGNSTFDGDHPVVPPGIPYKA